MKSVSKYKPTQDYVLLRRVEGNLKTGNILLPETSQPKNHAIVVDVGPGRYTDQGAYISVTAIVGQRVIFNRAIELEHDLMLARDSEILAVVNE